MTRFKANTRIVLVQVKDLQRGDVVNVGVADDDWQVVLDKVYRQHRRTYMCACGNSEGRMSTFFWPGEDYKQVVMEIGESQDERRAV